MSMDVFLNFNGNCREAIEFYAKVFDCPSPRFMTFGEMPEMPGMPSPAPEWKDLIMYCSLPVAGHNLMLSDTTPMMPYHPGNNINITLGSLNKTDILTWFERLRVGADVHMEPQKTFWSDCYCMLTDKFGIPWQLSLDSGSPFTF